MFSPKSENEFQVVCLNFKLLPKFRFGSDGWLTVPYKSHSLASRSPAILKMTDTGCFEKVTLTTSIRWHDPSGKEKVIAQVDLLHTRLFSLVERNMPLVWNNLIVGQGSRVTHNLVVELFENKFTLGAGRVISIKNLHTYSIGSWWQNMWSGTLNLARPSTNKPVLLAS